MTDDLDHHLARYLDADRAVQRAVTDHTVRCARCGTPVVRLVHLGRPALVLPDHRGAPLPADWTPPPIPEGVTGTELLEAAFAAEGMDWQQGHRNRGRGFWAKPVDVLDDAEAVRVVCDCRSWRLEAEWLKSLFADRDETVTKLEPR